MIVPNDNIKRKKELTTQHTLSYQGVYQKMNNIKLDGYEWYPLFSDYYDTFCLPDLNVLQTLAFILSQNKYFPVTDS